MLMVADDDPVTMNALKRFAAKTGATLVGNKLMPIAAPVALLVNTAAEIAVGIEDGWRWYVVHTETRREQAVAQDLRGRALYGYAPAIRVPVRHARTVRITRRPMFPGYIFVNCLMTDENWQMIRHTTGVLNLLGTGRDPAVILDESMGDIMLHEDRLSREPVISKRRGNAVGQVIKIKDGQFAGFTGRIDELDDEGRISVLKLIASGDKHSQDRQ